MSNTKFYLKNALCDPGVVLMNGSGGSAPALDENPDWRTRNTLVPDRDLYWRAQAGGLGPAAGVYQFDYDLGSAVAVAAAGFTKVRLYPTGLLIGSSTIEAYYGSSYPPATPVGLAIALASNNNMKEFSPQSARYWRVEVVVSDINGLPMEISGNPWLVRTADVLDLGKSASPGSRVTNARVQRELRTPSGVVFKFEPGQTRGSGLKNHDLLFENDGGTILALLRDTLGAVDTRFLMVDYEGTVVETTFSEGELSWSRLFGAPDNYAIPLRVVDHP